MKRSKLIAAAERLKKNSKEPWACFETSGPDKDGRVGFSVSYNQAFIDNLTQLGLSGMTDEETVQLFFLQMRMVPEGVDQEAVNPTATPNLTNEANRFVR